MNDDQAFDRALQAWLSKADDRAPSDLIHGAAVAARSTPQERPVRLPWAPPGIDRQFPRPLLIAATLVLGALAVTLAALVGRPLEDDLPTPPPSIAPVGFPGVGTVAYSRLDPATGQPALFLIDPTARNETRVVDGYGCCAVFAPNGRSIAVGFEQISDFRAPGRLLKTAKVILIDGREQGGLPGFCGGCGSMQGIEWLPRAWSSVAGGDVIALEVRGIVVPPAGPAGLENARAADGIHVIAPDAGSPLWYWNKQYLTGKGVRDVPIAVSPDGDELLFLRVLEESESSLRGDLSVVRISDGQIRRINADGIEVVTGGQVIGAGWSPDGRQIAFVGYESGGAVGRLYVADAQDGNPVVLPEDANSVAWSPDGAWIAVSVVGDRGDLLLIRPDGSEVRNLTADFDTAVVGPRWAPDGLSLLAVASPAQANGAGNLVVVPIDGRSIAQITTVPGAYAEWSWSPVARKDL